MRAVLMLCLCACLQAADKPPVLMIVVDDLRDWTGYTDAHPQVETD